MIMGSVYEIDKNKNLILYSTGLYVCLRSCSGENIARPVILANDYKENLSDIIFKGTLYYCYQNIKSDIIIRSITDTKDLFRLNSQDAPDCFLPKIISIGEQLLFFYFVKNPIDDSYCLKCILPFNEDKVMDINQSFAVLPNLSVMFNTKLAIVNVCTNDTSVIFVVDEQLNITKLVSEKMITNIDKKNIDKKNIDNKKIDKLQQEIKQRDEIIESIKKQYNELMDTANQYRNEAIKWRGYVLNLDNK